MAMVKCPNCGEMISDRASECVHCGCKLNNFTVQCPECGIYVSEDLKVCPKCGCPLHEKQPKRIDKKNVLKIVLVVILCLVIAAFSFLFIQYNRYSSYYNKVNEIHDVRNASVDALNDSAKLLIDVWNNAIWLQSDPRTDKFTKENGYFVDDFNDALDNLYSDEVFNAKLDIIDKQQYELRLLRKGILNPPKGEEEFNNLILDMIDNYLDLSTTVLNPIGSLNEVSEELNELFEEDNKIQRKLEYFAN